MIEQKTKHTNGMAAIQKNKTGKSDSRTAYDSYGSLVLDSYMLVWF